MMSRLVNEHYKGRTIGFVHKITGGKPAVVGRWWFEGKIQQIVGPNKTGTFERIKRIIDRY